MYQIGADMRPQLVYDFPTRVFHWLFAGLFLIAFVIAKTTDTDSPFFGWHGLAGLTIGFLILLRLVWGIVGTKHAKFSKFPLNPKDLVAYFGAILSGSKKRWAGHNPASSWAAVFMILVAVGLTATGYMMASGIDKEKYEDIHEILANIFVIISVLHVAGIILHTIRHSEMIALSMINGKKSKIRAEDEIQQSKPIMAIVFIALVVAFGIYLNKNYDSDSQSVKVFGTNLQIGDAE
jgi:cytochrome b